jgi:uncharacterized membrane protein YedE/YeeE
MTDFTPISSTLGGVLIGASASAMLLLNGKVAGISGIVGGMLRPAKGDGLWRVLFVAGLLSAGFVFSRLRPDAIGDPPAQPLLVTAIAGLLVGFGTQLANGCTSGHGVCGLSRLSMRSLVATLTFMATGAATVLVVRHLWRGP